MCKRDVGSSATAWAGDKRGRRRAEVGVVAAGGAGEGGAAVGVSMARTVSEGEGVRGWALAEAATVVASGEAVVNRHVGESR